MLPDFSFDAPAQNGGQAAPYGRGTKAPQSRPQQGFRLPGATCAAGWRTALQKKVKPCRNFHPWNVN